VLDLDAAPARGIAAAALADLLARGGATLLDLSSSRAFRDGHIESAWFAIRTRLAHALSRVPLRGALVLTSEDGVLTRLALHEAEALAPGATFLEGGTAAWLASGRPLVSGDSKNMADEPLDLWLKAYERASGVRDAMEEYLRWEIDLVHRIEEDGTCHFWAPG
jgi:rhodanese-related sulfurtransferase